MRGRGIVASLVALVCVLGVAAGAEAHGGGRWRTIKVHFDVQNYEYLPVEPTPCDPAAPANCVAIAKIPGFTTTGDLVGTGVEVATGTVTPSNLAIGRGVGIFSGVVKGCGTGGFVYTQATRADLNTNQGHTLYTITAGTGSGQLEGITGSFEEGVGPVRCHPH